MTLDPRSKNEIYSLESAGDYLAGYADRMRDALARVDRSALERACALIEDTARRGAHVYSVGNGGSAAICEHLCCDWTKGTDAAGFRPIRSHSLVGNQSLYSAIANDFGFAEVFLRQLDYYADSGDVLVAISGSGTSANIVNAVRRAREIGMKVVGLTGFDGGELRKLADIALHVEANNYGMIEDCHQSLMHVIAQYIGCKRVAGRSARAGQGA